jgi:hypothetical protein
MAPEGTQLKQPIRASSQIQNIEMQPIDVNKHIDDIQQIIKVAKSGLAGAFRGTEGTGENALDALPSDNKKLLNVMVKQVCVGVAPTGGAGYPAGTEAVYIAFLSSQSKNEKDMTAITIITRPDNKTVFVASSPSGSQIPDYLQIEKKNGKTTVSNFSGDKV